MAASPVRTEISPLLALNERQRLFVQYVADGKSGEVALRMAGYNVNYANGNSPAVAVARLLANPKIQVALKEAYTKLEHKALMTRKRVLDGFLEAIDQAKVMSEPMAQIAGWREIARMCGYFAPETRNVNVNISTNRVVSQLELKSDAELLQIIEGEAELIVSEDEAQAA